MFKERVIVDNYKKDNSTEILCIVLFVFSLLVISGVAWVVN